MAIAMTPAIQAPSRLFVDNAVVNLLRLENVPILQQLQLEEALLRTDTGNWCIINRGSPPAIVMGISGKAEELLNTQQHATHTLPLIRRFSGGGTVVVDSDTLFVTFIVNTKDVPIAAPFPQHIMQWTSQIYSQIIPSLALKENDYVIGNKKCGGNAQHICKKRWLHHSTFLWDYDPAKMNVLTLPNRRPTYRADRQHTDFVCTLKEHFPEYHPIENTFAHRLETLLPCHTVTTKNALYALEMPHRKSTRIEE